MKLDGTALKCIESHCIKQRLNPVRKNVLTYSLFFENGCWYCSVDVGGRGEIVIRRMQGGM